MRDAGPLMRVRVLEVGGHVSAPFAAKLLADYGAEAVKVGPRLRHGARDEAVPGCLLPESPV